MEGELQLKNKRPKMIYYIRHGLNDLLQYYLYSFTKLIDNL
jgi:hypothetical protein